MTPDLTAALQLVTRFVDEYREHSDTCFFSRRAEDIEDGMGCDCEVLSLDAALARIVRACEVNAELLAALEYCRTEARQRLVSVNDCAEPIHRGDFLPGSRALNIELRCEEAIAKAGGEDNG